VVPLNLIGDFGGGGMLLAFGVVCAMLEAQRSGKGQVVDAAMVDGASVLMTMMYGAYQSGFWQNTRGSNMLDGGALYLAFGVTSALWEAQRSGRGQCVDAAMLDGVASEASFLFGLHAAGAWTPRRGSNALDGGAHFYGVYETADGKYVSIGSIEPQFYALLLDKLGIAAEELPHQLDARHWDALKERFAAIFRTRTREEWCRLMEGSDVCFAPVLGLDEITGHAHIRARSTFIDDEGAWQPAPAPRFSRTAPGRPARSVRIGADTDALLAEAGYSAEQIAQLRASGAAA
jgi:alpha-methylacyl-CoA racemase